MADDAASKLEKLNKAKTGIRVLDWVFAIVVLGYGLWSMSWFFIALGVLSVGLVLYNPAKRVELKINSALAAHQTKKAKADSEKSAQ